MIRVKKIALIGMIILFTLTLCGCWDMIDLSSRSLIVGIGIDKSDEKGKIILTIQYVLPKRVGTPSKPSSENKSSVYVLSIKADSLSEAIINYKALTKGRPYFKQNRILIIGEDVASEGISSVLDFFIRYTDCSPQCWILFSRGKAADILRWNSEEESIPTYHIADLLKTNNYDSSVTVSDIHDFEKKLASETTSPVATAIKIKKSNDNTPLIDVSKTAVFDKDKLVGWLDINETNGLAYIMNKHGNWITEIKSLKKSNISFSYITTKTRTKIKAELIDGIVTMRIEVKSVGDVIMQGGSVDLSDQDNIKEIEGNLNKEIKNKIKACIDKVQNEYQSDILGFGEAIHRSLPKEWRELEPKWEEEFPNTTVKIIIDSKIRNIGVTIGTIKP